MPEFDSAVTQTVEPYTITDFEKDVSDATATMGAEAIAAVTKFATAMSAACRKAKDAGLPKHVVVASLDNSAERLESLRGKTDDAMATAFPDIKDFLPE